MSHRDDVDPVRLLAVTSVADALGLDRRDAAVATAAGLVGRQYVAGPRRFVLEATAREVGARPFVSEHPEALVVVRVTDAVRAEGDPSRNYVGWSAQLSDDDAEAGVDRWWSVADPARFVGWPFVATLKSFVVHVGRIDSVERSDAGTWFHLSKSPDLVRHYADKRVKSPRGGPIVYLPAGMVTQ